MTNQEIKSFSLRQLSGNWGALIIGVLLFSFLYFIPLGLFVFLGNVIFLLIADPQSFFAIPGADLFFSFIQDCSPMALGIATAVLLFLACYLGVSFGLSSQKMMIRIARGAKVHFYDIFRDLWITDQWWAFFRLLLLQFLINLVISIPSGVCEYMYGIDSVNSSLVEMITGTIRFFVSLYLIFSSYALADHKNMGAFEAIRTSVHLMRNRKLRLFLFQLSFIGWFLLCTVSCGIALFFVLPYFAEALTIFYLSAYSEDYETPAGEVYDV